MTTICIILSLDVSYSWYVNQLNVNTPFLHGDLEEDLNIKIPYSLSVCNKSLLCKLSKFIYGLKKTSRLSNQKPTYSLTNLGYIQSKYD